jgi:hypothetical protein
VEWLILLVLPVALLVVATHMLGTAVVLRELPRTWRQLGDQYRAMPRRTRMLNFAFLFVCIACAVVFVWVIETPSTWGTARWVLLVGVGLFALYVVVVMPVFVWREYRDHKRRRAQAD